MASGSGGSHKFQAPKGLRDFYPAEMAARRYVENVWREVSINHGFEEVEGPTFEHVELYTHKSGPGIVSEIFGVFSGKDEGQVSGAAQGQAPYALRPEFTPTLARMVAAKAQALPMPVKWFAIPSHFRAERPQRGRLREFVQWNVDFIGVPEGGMYVHRTDVEIIQIAVAALQAFGLKPTDVRVKLAHRGSVRRRIISFGRTEDQADDDLLLLDARSKIDDREYRERAIAKGWSQAQIEQYSPTKREIVRLDVPVDALPLEPAEKELVQSRRTTPGSLDYEIQNAGLAAWCEFDSEIVRGLAYYTGTVFEIHEASGAERAIAGGGRYDKLIESFGGPSLPACGFGMGDVVLSLVLQDKGLLKEERFMEPLRPDVFVIAASDAGAEKVAEILADLRRAGFHARHSYKTTRNVGKLLGDAGKARARWAVIVGDDIAQGRITVKNLDGGEQREIDVTELSSIVRSNRA